MTKPGWKTTEFWQAMAAIAGSLFCLVYGAVNKEPLLIATGVGGLGLASTGYGISRGAAKKNAPEE